jgi:hypothetical protein
VYWGGRVSMMLDVEHSASSYETDERRITNA